MFRKGWLSEVPLSDLLSDDQKILTISLSTNERQSDANDEQSDADVIIVRGLLFGSNLDYFNWLVYEAFASIHQTTPHAISSGGHTVLKLGQHKKDHQATKVSSSIIYLILDSNST